MYGLFVASTLLPVCLWYAYAVWLASISKGSSASAHNAAIWASSVGLMGLFNPLTFRSIVKSVFFSAFTPIGTLLAACGLGFYRANRRTRERSGDGLWLWWSIAAALALAATGAKLHHDYYWLMAAPAAAGGVGLAVAQMRATRGTAVGGMMLAMLTIASFWQFKGTFETPREWASLQEAAEAVQRFVPRNALLVAPEALLYASDRRGCRLEFDPNSANRAAREWGETIRPGDGSSLVEAYQRHGAGYLADLGPATGFRAQLRAEVRRKSAVLVDRPCVFVVKLDKMIPSGKRKDALADEAHRVLARGADHAACQR